MARALDFLASDDEDGGNTALTSQKSAFDKASNAPRSSRNDDDDDAQGDSAFIAAAHIAQNKKAATQVVKDSMLKGKSGSKKAASKAAAAGGLTGGGSFQSMGINPSLVRSLLLRGYANPTPIQRVAIPAILEQPTRDVVGMARTGSGKTLAYTIPLIQHLNGRHSTSFGVKALILCPSRELALQILRVGKDLARGWKGGADGAEGGDDPSGLQRSEAIRWALIVGGEGMDEQFALMANNPDVVIATPGRLLHLAVEMNLDLSSVSYVVFDEADRLFEMGFAEQLTELLHRLPLHRQTLLFSATLPKSMVDFARAGLGENPKLVRLDVDSKVSAELRMGFFSIKPAEKDAALLILLKDLIGVPYGAQEAPDAELEEAHKGHSDDEDGGRSGSRNGGKGKFGKGKGKGKGGRSAQAGAISGADQLRPHQTIIFCATKHHVEYLLLLLTTAGYACSHIYSSLDQAARSLQMARFRRGETSLLIVTDVAARGIDLPVLEHVINYDFPTQPRVFVHRVGRTARAGRKGWAWSLVTNAELAFLLDLQLFLARPLVPSPSPSITSSGKAGDEAEAEILDCAGSLVLGTLSRESLDQQNEYIASGLTNADSAVAVALPALRAVVKRAQSMYERSQTKASQESYRRAKEMVKAAEASALGVALAQQGHAQSQIMVTRAKKAAVLSWRLAGTPLEEDGIHDVLRRPHAYGLNPLPAARANNGAAKSSAEGGASQQQDNAKMAAARAALLAKVSAFSPAETVFEQSTGKNRAASSNSAAAALEAAALMRERRKVLEKKRAKAAFGQKKEEMEFLEDVTGGGEIPGGGAGGEEEGEKDGMDVDQVEGDKEVAMADEKDIQDLFGVEAATKESKKRKRAEAEIASDSEDEDVSDGESGVPTKGKFRDPRFYLDYQQKDAMTERGYSLANAKGSSFVEQARLATFGLSTDEATLGTQTQRVNAQRWDTKKSKFIRGDGVGSDNKKLIRTESGARLPASFRSGRWEEWKKEKRVEMPKVGERELERSAGGGGGGGGPSSSSGGKTFRHTSMKAPKPLDKLSKDYDFKLKQRQRRDADAAGGGGGDTSFASSSGPARGGKNFSQGRGGHTGDSGGASTRGGGGRGGGAGRGGARGRGGKSAGGTTRGGPKARNELRSASDIQKNRALLAKRKEKNARPSKKKARRK
ncbi:unnamed protein product [Tilletia controversa]|nr:hypothetical protein CF328_g739 [Tilletia controversa]CAD6897590.1 unnamed protein product [Tilletia controversa]CAD6969526.1 unnamed protein product [Tilletia controversa]CAD6981442.1 unnamed protein product [Tilletia controversa]